MARYRDPPTSADRATAITAVVAVHLMFLALLMLGGQRLRERDATPPPTQLIDVTLPPPPPPPVRPAPKAASEAGAAGKKAEPSPVVAPPPRILVPAVNPLPAAPVAGNANAASAGAANAGSGPGAGGNGSGTGAGGGGNGAGIGEDARLISGGLNRRDYRRLGAFAAPSGRAVLALLIGPDGQVARCTPRESSGDPALDAALCAILAPRMIWAPARDRSGTPLTVGIYYTAIWSRD